MMFNCGRAQSLVGNAVPGLVVLDSIRKQIDQVRGKQVGKQHLSTASASDPASRILPCSSSCPLISFSDEQECVSVSQMNPFLPTLSLGHGVFSLQWNTGLVFHSQQCPAFGYPLDRNHLSRGNWPFSNVLHSQDVQQFLLCDNHQQQKRHFYLLLLQIDQCGS